MSMHAHSTWSSGSPPPNRRSCPRYRIIIIISRAAHGTSIESRHAQDSRLQNKCERGHAAPGATLDSASQTSNRKQPCPRPVASSETAIRRHQNQAFFFEASVHAQSTCSSPGIVIHVASILRENPNRHHSPSRLRKAQFITHQSIRHPDINPPPSACCTQKRIVTSKK